MLSGSKPFGLLLGLMGNFAMAWGISKLIANGSCGGDLPACPDSLNSAFILLIGGIFVSMAAIFLGGGALIFLGIFLSIGVGSLIAGLGAEDSETKSFGTIFGLSFAGVPLLLVVLGAWASFRGKGKLARAQSLIATGAKGVGTVTEVRDTGMTINDNPRVEVTMSVQPSEGGQAFPLSKTVTASRVAIPRAGDRFPVWYDRADPSSWAYGTDLDPAEAAPDVQELFAQAATPAAPAVDGPADELSKLNDLRLKGVLTDAEFETAKARLLKT